MLTKRREDRRDGEAREVREEEKKKKKRKINLSIHILFYNPHE